MTWALPTQAGIVGRLGELEALRSALARPGQAVFLVGEAGIGKTRLAVQCAADAASRNLPVMRGRAGSAGVEMPLRPLAEALSSLFRSRTLPDADELSAYRPALARLLPQWRTEAAESPRPEALVEFSEAMVRLLTTLARPTGCLMVLEDLHDSDPETLAVLEYLVDNLAGTGAVLVGTLRDEPCAAAELVHGAQARGAASVLHLLPLTPTQVREQAAGCLAVETADLPEPVSVYLTQATGGNPYLVEVLLANLIDTGLVWCDSHHRWQAQDSLAPAPPDSVVSACVRQLDRLLPLTRRVVLMAAVLGERFTLADLSAVCGIEDQTLVGVLRGAAGFVTEDRQSTSDYVFRHALTVDALLAYLHPAEHTALAKAAATALSDIGNASDLHRQHLVARLLTVAQDPRAAGACAEAGRRALAAGAAGSAVSLLSQAAALADATDRPAIIASLIEAFASSGQLDKALETLRTQPPEILAGISTKHEIALRTRLAWASVTLGRMSDAADQVELWEQRFAGRVTEQETAGMLVVRAYLILYGHEEDAQRERQAEAMATEAAAIAERAGLPEIACQAWQLLGLATRRADFAKAAGYHERMLAVAQRHDLPLWRADALLRLAGNHFMSTGSPDRLQQVVELTRQLGAHCLEMSAQGALAMAHAMRAEHDAALDITASCLTSTSRMKLYDEHSYLLLVSAIVAAHRGRRNAMNEALASFENASEDNAYMVPLALGLARAFCALLEEDRDLAVAELTEVDRLERAQPALYLTAGRFGLGLLLAELAGPASDAHLKESLSHPATRLKWNAQFAFLAEAVSLGRKGRARDAMRNFHAARDAGAAFPTAWHLGLRLVAPAALSSQWGNPLDWLRQAEEYFQDAAIPSVASACRSLLRDTGVPARQRRQGMDRIPDELRRRGVTTREYEVFLLMADRPGNREIARRLFMSPRTAEKHVASLIAKLGVADRRQLCERASTAVD